MHHPDDMTPAQEFKILCDERPTEADAILAQGANATAMLHMLNMSLMALLSNDHKHQNQLHLGKLHRKDTLPTVAMQYGVLMDRHVDLVHDLSLLHSRLVNALVTMTICPSCGVDHSIEEPRGD